MDKMDPPLVIRSPHHHHRHHHAQAAVDLKEPVVVYPVKSLSNFSTDGEGGAVFGHALLVQPGSTVRSVVRKVASGMVEYLQYAELWEAGGTRRRVGEEHVLAGQANIIKFYYRPVEEKAGRGAAGPPPQQGQGGQGGQGASKKKRDKEDGDGGGGGGGGGGES